MATKKKQQEELAPEQEIQNALSKTEKFIEENTKTLIIALAAIVIIVGGVFGYKYLVSEPRAEKAAAAIFVAEQLFNQGEYQQALDGDGVNAGFLSISADYASTPQGNIANHYAGVCYYKLGDYQNAISYLKKYSTTKGQPNIIINAQNAGLIGDAMVQSGDVQGAVAYFQTAVECGDNVLTTPYYLKKLGMAYESLGKLDEAKSAFERIYYEYPTSMEANEVLKFLGSIEATE